VAGERVLVVDDEASLREFLTILFEREGYTVRTASTGEEALALVPGWRPDLVLTDLNMPGMDGIELLRQLKSHATPDAREIPVILVTAYGTIAHAVAAMREGAFDYVAKPFHNDELRLMVAKALALRRLEEDNARLRAELGERYQLEGIVGASPRMNAVFALVARVRSTRINCLVCGESGTGKELIARAIHFGSDRAQGPFVPVNCGAIPEALFESELFGHRKGSFTGAVRDKNGFFQAADGGTLFLDEVGEMPLSAQVKVLRALAERKVTPVGGTAEIPVDVRIVAATNRDLAAHVAAGAFREDLYYRLNVVEIDVPPLRERPEDLHRLVEHFVARFAEEYRQPVQGISPEALRVLHGYPFPGNVRELQNIIERAVALETGPLITVASLPERVHGGMGAVSPDEAQTAEIPGTGIDLEGKLAALERRYLERALHQTNGNRTQAARLLGITFRSFRYRLLKFGMDAGDE